MAGVVSFVPIPVFRPVHRRHNLDRRFRVSAEVQETPAPPAEDAAKPVFVAPEPKPFSVRPDQLGNVLGASLSLLFRLGTGIFAQGYSASFVPKDEFPSDKYALTVGGYKVKETATLGPRPEKPIEIYEFESCPFCRKVREVVAILDIDVLFYPCPRNGPNFRPKAIQLGGKKQFPYMVDPNTNTAMYESDDIIKYLVNTYGDGTIPLMLSLGLFTTLTEGFAMIGRMGKKHDSFAAPISHEIILTPNTGLAAGCCICLAARVFYVSNGSSYTPSKLPPLPLELWAYEGSPFCKLVREVLVELELPHIQRSVARGSPKRQILYEKAGHFQVPYLEDPNTGVSMFESAEIVNYLRQTYAL